MMMFAVAAALLLALAMLFVVPPLLRRRADSRSSAGPDLAIFRDQLADLERDLQSGTLAADRYAQARSELERRLAEELEANTEETVAGGESRVISGIVIAAVPLLAVALYLLIGTPQVLDPQAMAAEDAAHSVTAEQIEQMVSKLAQRLEKEPDDAAGWSMLGRSYAALERFKEAADAYKAAPNAVNKQMMEEAKKRYEKAAKELR